MKKTTKIIIVLLIVIIAGITVVTSMKHAADGSSEVSAEKAAMAYAEAIDYQYENPAVIYEFMTDDFRKVMDKSEFIRAFKKERSYPYLTPLFINYDRVELNEDGTTALLIIPRQPDCREWSMKLDLFMRIPTGISRILMTFWTAVIWTNSIQSPMI